MPNDIKLNPIIRIKMLYLAKNHQINRYAQQINGNIIVYVMISIKITKQSTICDLKSLAYQAHVTHFSDYVIE